MNISFHLFQAGDVDRCYYFFLEYNIWCNMF